MVVSTLSLLGLATVRATLLNFGRHLLGYIYIQSYEVLFSNCPLPMKRQMILDARYLP